MNNMRVVLVTGANTGLGYQIVRAICSSERPYEVLVGGRSMAKAEQAVKQLKEEFPTSHVYALQVDIEDDDSIARSFEQVKDKYGKLDALVNNAGTQLDQQLANGALTARQIWNQTYNVNVTGTHIMTATFAPLLLKSSDPRLLFIASGASSLTTTENTAIPFNKPPPKGWPKAFAAAGVPAYRSSKTGMNMMMREWCRTFEEDGVKVWCVSPGFLATGLGAGQDANKKRGAIDPAIGAALVKDVLEGERDGDVGKVVSRQGVQPW